MNKNPTHVGYILDGNRRWAKAHGLPTYEGHLAGYNALYDVIEATSDAGVKFISLYTFSTQNWNRTEEEIRGIMRLIRRLFKQDIKRLVKDNYKVVVLGSRDGLPSDIADYISEAETISKDGARATLAICFNYGGQEEIVRAVQRIVGQKMSSDEVTLETVAANLDAPHIPPCDLIVRTSGEQRLSDFMLWRSAYSELLFLDKFWPEMTKEDVTAILDTYSQRKRRFGG